MNTREKGHINANLCTKEEEVEARTNRYLYCTQGRVEQVFHLRRFTEKALKEE